MRLFGFLDGILDRLDRAGWLTPPFDLAFGKPSPFIAPFTPRERVMSIAFEDRVSAIMSESRIISIASEDRRVRIES
jgi:hypothetical protein